MPSCPRLRCCRIYPRSSTRVDPRKSAYLSFITGPSRTADIERVLTIGVHGPERLIIVLVDDLEVAAVSSEFKQSILDALANPNLSGALGRFSEAYRVSRAKAYEGIDFEAVRTQIAEIKSSAASHFDELAEKFASVAESRGTKVFRTSDPQAVKDYILRLAQERGVKSDRQVEVHGLGGDSSQRASGKGRH